MQILANVDESDIGQIKEGQDVRFTVQAQPDRKFSGQVSQIRLEPTTVNNVVNYTVVVNVANEDGLLLPGMTATIDFLVGQAKNVLRVANAALRVKPNPEMRAGADEAVRAPEPAGQGGASAGRTAGDAGGGVPRDRRRRQRQWQARPKDVGLLWYLDAAGKIKAIRVKTGITDGQMTEISSGRAQGRHGGDQDHHPHRPRNRPPGAAAHEDTVIRPREAT